MNEHMGLYTEKKAEIKVKNCLCSSLFCFIGFSLVLDFNYLCHLSSAAIRAAFNDILLSGTP